MSRRPPRLLIADMLERIERISNYVAGFDREAFLRDSKTTDSVVRNLEVIGEAASRLPTTFRNRHPDIPWSRIVGLRNRVVHAYFDVDLELVWEIVHVELPELRVRLLALPQESVDEQKGSA
jgi:uncharacterized protein with HEPN domain